MIWQRIAGFVIKTRFILLFLLLAATAYMGYEASQVQMSYEFTRAIPVDNPKYLAYQEFRKKFGEDGNLLVAGMQTDKFFTAAFFDGLRNLSNEIKNVPGVDYTLSVPIAVSLVKDEATEKLIPKPLFPAEISTQTQLDSARDKFLSLPFYQGLLYNPGTKTYLFAININKEVLNSSRRTATVQAITGACDRFGEKYKIDMHYSGLPLIRTNMATKVASEMKWFLVGSILLSALILFLFFRSFSSMLLSLAVVLIGVVWCMGTIQLFGYKITLLTGVIPPLMVVIGIPNCIYFLNKYHTSFIHTRDKMLALREMIRRMGVVTLFCNITAAIGFAVFALTRSAVLKEFGVVAGINIMMLFFISFILLPSILSLLPPPKERHMNYLENKSLVSILQRLEVWTIRHRGIVLGVTLLVLGISGAGMLKLKSEGFIVDDLPKNDKIYQDLKFFESNFRGVMPLEIVIDAKRKNGLKAALIRNFEKIDSLSAYIGAKPELSKPLSIVEALKFARQAYYNGDSANYLVPNQTDLVFLAPYLNTKNAPDSSKKNNLSRLTKSFIDSNWQEARISVNMADIGSVKLPVVLNDIQQKSNAIFDSAKYKVTLTGSSVTFLEGSIFIIKGLKESILYAFLLIAACMLYLFRSLRILLCSLIPNVIPLIITAGVMGWVGISLKPSTVIVFSIALGIAIDITIRFLVNYKQDLEEGMQDVQTTVIKTIHTTGISIIYTSLVLIVGFGIFCFSGFGGTKALGWLTSLTLVMATLTNLVFLPTLLMIISGKRKDK